MLFVLRRCHLECWKGIIKWIRMSESWKFLSEFSIPSKQQISIFPSALLSGFFYHSRRVSSEISKDWMIIGMINWFIILAVSEKLSHNFLISKVILSDPLHWIILIRTSLSTRPMLHFGFMGDLYSLTMLWDLELWGTHKPSYIPWLLLKQKCLMKLHFMRSGWLAKSSCFYILPDCEVSLSEVICI